MSGGSTRRIVGVALIGAALVALGVVGATGAAAVPGTAPTEATALGAAGPSGQAIVDDGANGNGTDELNVSVGAQLSTVIETRSSEVEADVANVRFTVEYEDGDRAAAVEDRAEDLHQEAAAIREGYRNATAAYRNGTLSREEYAQRVATLHDEAEDVRESARDLWDRVQDLDRETRASVSVNQTTIGQIADGLEGVDGAGPRALLARFTGHDGGELEFEVGRDGLRIEALSDDGEFSREVRRLGDDSLAVTVSQDDAEATARDALSTGYGDWTLVEERVNDHVGYYHFEYDLDADNQTGEAEVRVDASADVVLRLEEEVEADGAEDGDDADERSWLHPDDGWDDDREERWEEWEDRWEDHWADRWEDRRNDTRDRNHSFGGWFGDHEWGDGDHRDGWVDDGDSEEADRENGGDSDEADGEDSDTGDSADGRAWTDRDADSDDGIALAVTNGTVAPGETVTLSVTVEGNATADVPVLVNGDVAGTTDADGQVSITIPEGEEVSFSADTGDREAELEFEFDDSGIWGG